MGDLERVREWLPERLAQVAARHRVPGAAAAVLAGGEIADAAYGVLSRSTGVAVTTDSVFQIGSITKVWTASLIMQLVDEGRLDLDAPVRRYLPEFRVADEPASAQVTVRQLCCHTAGFEGDIFTDTGRGEDAIEKYLTTITEVPQVFPPGERFSYNNAGYVVLGRLVEVLRGKPYGVALREHLIAPLGLTHAATDAYEAILHRAAVGHLMAEPGAEPAPAPVWALVPSNAPAGSMLAMSAADLLRFAQLHLDGGGELLSGASVTAMQQRQVEVPYLGYNRSARGLGWQILDWDGGTTIGHDGGTIGQSAFLRVVPAAGVAVVLLTNGGEALPLYHAIVGRALAELAGVRIPDPPVPPAAPVAAAVAAAAEAAAEAARETATAVDPVDPHRYVGRYQAQVASYQVSVEDTGRLWLSMTPHGTIAEAGIPPERYEIVRLAGDTFISAEPKDGTHATLAFLEPDPDGRARFLYQSRVIPRAD